MQVSLTVVGGVHNGKVIPLNVPEFRIGRDPKCHLRPASDDVSRHHCSILIRPDNKVFLRDFGSRNGTILNRRMMVNGELQLESNDIIEIGPLVFKLLIDVDAPTPAARPASKPTEADEESALSAILSGDDAMDDSASIFGREPSAEETIQVSKHRIFANPPPRPLTDAGPMLADE